MAVASGAARGPVPVRNVRELLRQQRTEDHTEDHVEDHTEDHDVGRSHVLPDRALLLGRAWR
jgi:hypothetical protein